MTAPLYTEAWLSGFDGHQFYTRTWAAADAKAVMLYVHGFADHIARYDHVHVRWPERGFTLFAYDMRGFGRTALDQANRSPDEQYGKTSRAIEVQDLEWWITYLAKEYPGLPLFLMGYSAGGGLALAFPTRENSPPSPSVVAKLSGVIANAPLVHLTYPPSWLTKTFASGLGVVIPSLKLAAPMPEERFSRDPAAVARLKQDKWRHPYGTVKGLSDMVVQGEQLLEKGYQLWPKNLPLLVIHGSADEANCPKAAQAFFDKVDVEDKKFISYPDAFHDLVNEINGVSDKVVEDCFAWMEDHIPSR